MKKNGKFIEELYKKPLRKGPNAKPIPGATMARPTAAP